MDIQIKAGLRKELSAFLRSKRFLIAALVFIAISILTPLLMWGLGLLMEVTSSAYDQLGMDSTGMVEEISPLFLTASSGVGMQISYLSTYGLLLYLLLMNSYAGGEQKRRSIIIPQISGLSSRAYILPKFIIYPPAVFIMSLIGVLIASLVSTFIFEYNDLTFTAVLASGVVLGVFLMFFACLHLALGTATGKAGMSSAICIVASMLLPSALSIIDATPAYNPFTLSVTATSTLYGAEKASEVIIGIIIALAIMVAAFFIALFVRNAKKIDNSGNEVLI